MDNNSIFIVFIGILISDIVYQSGIVSRMYAKILNIEAKIRIIEERLK